MDILLTARWTAKWAGLVGLACGILYSVGGFLYDLFTTGLNAGTAMAFGALLGMPLIFWVAGFLLGAFVAFVVSAFRR